MKPTAKIIVISAFLAFCSTSLANELLVPSQYPTIQLAIDVAVNGDTVIVAPGTYTGEGNRDIDFLGKAITVRSQSGPDNCIIDCQQQVCGFYFHNAEDANSILDGFTITNGHGRPGGGILCDNGSPKIINCIITGNSADRGGGIYCYDSNLTITNCTITGNSAGHYGGGIYADGRWDSSLVIIINNCTITGNTANEGGGIYCCEHGNLTITNCIVNDNDGGGIYCSGNTTKITNCNITGNSTGYYGGGICCEVSNPTITNCNITGNSADYYGGGIYCNGDSPTIAGCTITGNTAREGGGIFGCGGPITNCTIAGNSAAGCSSSGGGLALCDGPITNCTIANNSADSYGGGLIVGREPFSPIKNCIIWNNWPDQIYGDYIPVAITYSDVQGGYSGLGNIDADPCFVDADANDYHLKSEGWSWDVVRHRWTYDDVTSRCIDAGNPGSPLGDELLSVPRDPNNIWGQNLRIDMGSFGGTAEASIPPYDWVLLSDLTNDGLVDLVDFAFQAADWLNSADQQPGDLNRDSLVGISDLALLVEDWLKQTTWH